MWVSQIFRGDWIGYKFFITCRSEDEEDIDFLFQMYGGYKYKQIKEDKVFWWFNAQDRQAIMILRIVYDELERDKELADLMLKFNKKLHRRKKTRLTDEQKQERLDWFNEVKTKYRKFNPEHNNSSVLTDQDTIRTLDEKLPDL